MSNTWTNVMDYGATGDGSTDDTTAISNAIAAAVSGGDGTVFFPAGTYLTDTISLDTQHVRMTFLGVGTQASCIRSRTGDHVFEVSSGTPYGLRWENLWIRGQGNGTGSGHGIYLHGGGGLPNLAFRNLKISQLTGSGLKIDRFFSTVFDSVDTDELGGDHFALTNVGPSVTLLNCYVHRVATGKVGFRIDSGLPVLIGCNGITPDSGYYGDWAILGATPALDGYTGVCRATILGFNCEDFTTTGIYVRDGSNLHIDNGKFQVRSGVANAIALRFDGSDYSMVQHVGPQITYFLVGGATWANGCALHATSLRGLVEGTGIGTQYWDDTFGILRDFSQMRYDTERALHITDLSLGVARLKTHSGYAESEELRKTAVLQTTGSSPTTIYSFTLAANRTYLFDVTVVCQKNGDGTKNAVFRRLYRVRHNGTSPIAINDISSASIDDYEGLTTATVSAAVSSGVVFNLQVTGETGTTINWGATVRYHGAAETT